jgi:hypothetical protein
MGWSGAAVTTIVNTTITRQIKVILFYAGVAPPLRHALHVHKPTPYLTPYLLLQPILGDSNTYAERHQYRDAFPLAMTLV